MPLDAAPLHPARAGTPPPSSREKLADRALAAVVEKLGFKPDGKTRRRLEKKLAELPVSEAAVFVRRMEVSPAQARFWLDLGAELTVHETFFYRDRDQLDHLRNVVLPECIAEKKTAGRRRLALWSAACSTGEEAWTLGVIALDALEAAGEIKRIEADLYDLKGWSITVLGTDVAPDVVDIAARGRYGEYEGLGPFRGTPEGFMSRFRRAPGEVRRGVEQPAWTPGRTLAAITRFHPLNLMEACPPITECDVVLCRNVMIYFDEEGKRRAVNVCRAALSTGGWLLVGPTDCVRSPLFAPSAVRTAPILRAV